MSDEVISDSADVTQEPPVILTEPTTAPVVEPTPAVESTTTSDAVVTAGPTSADKIRDVLAKVSVFFRTYSYEVFLIAFVVAIAAFVLLFPRTALFVGAVVAAVSGWVAYYGLRKRKTGSI